MAQALFVTRQAVSRWENGDTTPNLETLKQISKRFGISLNHLLATDHNTDDAAAEINAEIAYMNLFNKVRVIEEEHKEICKTFHRWNKNKHLKNMIESDYFRYCREIVFDNSEDCNVERFLAFAQNQGSLQTILKLAPKLIEKDYLTFQKAIYKIFDKGMDKVSFCYRMRIGVK